MHLFDAFELDVRPGTPNLPAAARVALLRQTRGGDGRLFITPECASFEEIEGQINSLQEAASVMSMHCGSEHQSVECLSPSSNMADVTGRVVS
jgi:hypothetical protein